jgi:hypothetical protein
VCAQLRIQRLVVEVKRVIAVDAGTQARLAGTVEQRVRIRAIGREHGDADPGADPGQVPAQIERLLERSEQPLAQRRGARGMVDVALNHPEFVGP